MKKEKNPFSALCWMKKGSLGFLLIIWLGLASLSSAMSYRSGRGRGGGRSSGREGGSGGGGGRGEYYRNKYGRGGRGRGGGGGRGRPDATANRPAPSGGGSYHDLQNLLRRLDGKSYPAYHDLDTDLDRGWTNSQKGFTLYCERAQNDPFAPPTRCRVVVDSSKASFPRKCYSNRIRSMALSDFLLRTLHTTCKTLGADSSMNGGGRGNWKGPKGGDVQVLEPCQHVLEQSAVRVDPSSGNVIAQITVNLPARGRTILGQAAESIFCETIPTMVDQLCYDSLSANQLTKHIDMVEDQVWLQDQLESRNVVAFIRNGAILPRRSGNDDRPMDPRKDPVPFQSPQRLEIEFSLPNAGFTIKGMGIPKGVSLICGGGFHGKSTVLETLQLGIYPKIPGDGREFCTVSMSSVKIRAEDGRDIKAVDISNFINNLPFGADTTCFSSENASGSTSQAASIVEAIECGANTLLFDEDTCATNFMVRDAKMMQLVEGDKEPITPFVRVVRSLYDDLQVSSILVIGGTGDYFDVADNVLVMDCYKCIDATEKAKMIVAHSKNSSAIPNLAPQTNIFQPLKGTRSINGQTFNPDGKVKVITQEKISFGETDLDLTCLEQLVTKAQTVAISSTLQRLSKVCRRDQSFKDTLCEIEKSLNDEGLDSLTPGQFNGQMARPRLFEIAGSINRLRRDSSITKT